MYTGIFLFPGVVGGIVLSEKLLSLYGPEFVKGAPVLQILLISVLIYGFQDQCVNALNAIDRPRLSFYSNIVFIFSNAVLNILLIYTFGWVGAAIATALSALIGLVTGYYLINNIVDIKIPILEIRHQLVASVIMGIVVSLLSEYVSTYLYEIPLGLEVICLVFIGAGIYVVTIMIFSEQTRNLFGKEVLSKIDFPSR